MNMSEPKSRVCPYLGLVEDRETTHISPSKVHRCFRYEPATRVKLDYQAAYCMASRHLECAVFLGKRVVVDPRRRGRQPGTIKRKGLSKGLGLTLGLLGAAGLAIWLGTWFGWFPMNWISGTNVKATSLAEPSPTKAATQALIVIVPATQTQARPTATPRVIPATVTPTPKAPTPTATLEAPTASATLPAAHALETPIGKTTQLVIHQVREGETLGSIAQDFQTTIDAIKAVNNFNPEPVQVNTLLVVPFHFLDVSGLPVFQVLQVKNDVPVEELAAQLGVDLSRLELYNNITEGAVLKTGDLILIPR